MVRTTRSSSKRVEALKGEKSNEENAGIETVEVHSEVLTSKKSAPKKAVTRKAKVSPPQKPVFTAKDDKLDSSTNDQTSDQAENAISDSDCVIYIEASKE
jgi:hypothetical protein